MPLDFYYLKYVPWLKKGMKLVLDLGWTCTWPWSWKQYFHRLVKKQLKIKCIKNVSSYPLQFWRLRWSLVPNGPRTNTSHGTVVGDHGVSDRIHIGMFLGCDMWHCTDCNPNVELSSGHWSGKATHCSILLKHLSSIIHYLICHMILNLNTLLRLF